MTLTVNFYKLSPTLTKFNQLRSYRPAVSPVHQEKILFIRSQLAAQGVATGQSRAQRNGLTGPGVDGIGMREAILRLKEADKKWIDIKNNTTSSESDVNKTTFGHNSLLLNVKVKLLKEQSNGFRGVLNIPHPQLLNKRPSILVFATGEYGKAALSAGANIVGGDELVGGLIEGTLGNFNRCLATTSMLPTVMKVARILGPKGLMPNVKTGTLVDSKDIASAVRSSLQSVPFKIEKCAGLLNMSLGSLSGSESELAENVQAVLDHLIKNLAGVNNQKYIERVYLSTRGHPGIQIKLTDN